MSFEEKIRVAFGERGEVWLVELPKQLEKIARLHELTGLAPFSNLSYNYVARATMKGKSVVLKVGIPGTDFTNEAVAMQALERMEYHSSCLKTPTPATILWKIYRLVIH